MLTEAETGAKTRLLPIASRIVLLICNLFHNRAVSCVFFLLGSRGHCYYPVPSQHQLCRGYSICPAALLSFHMRSVVHARLPWRLYSLVSQLNHLSSLPRLASLRHTPSAQRNITTTSLSPAPGPSPNQIQPNQDLGDPSSGGGEGKKQGNPKRFGAALDSAISTASGVLLLAGAGIFYHNCLSSSPSLGMKAS